MQILFQLNITNCPDVHSVSGKTFPGWYISFCETRYKREADGPTGIITEMIMADENLCVERLTALCNLTVAEGNIPIVFCYP